MVAKTKEKHHHADSLSDEDYDWAIAYRPPINGIYFQI